MRRLGTILMVIVLVSGVGCSLFIDPDADDGSGLPDPNDTKDIPTALADLGVNTTLGSRSDPKGHPLRDDYNPLGAKVGLLFKQSEIHMTGMSMDAEYNGLFGDKTENYTLLAHETGADWASGDYPKSSIEGDIDGDGFDEVVIAVAYGSRDEVDLRIFDYEDDTLADARVVCSVAVSDLANEMDGSAGGSYSIPAGYNEYGIWENAVFVIPNEADGYLRLDTAAGDLDGDGKDEILLAVGGNLYVIDDYTTGFNTLIATTLDNNPDKVTYVRVDAADFDIDGKEEIVVAVGEGDPSLTGRYTIFDDIEGATSLTPLDSDDLFVSGEAGLIAADVSCGDLDGDGLPEAAFSGKITNETGMAVMVVDTTMDADSHTVFTLLNTVSSDAYEDGPPCYITGIDTGDIDGDGKDEIATYNDILILYNGILTTHSAYGNEALKPQDNPEENYPNFDSIRVSDVTGDRKADVLFITGDLDQIYLFSTGSDGNIVESELGPYAPSDAENFYFPTLCLPNVDTDSAVMRYLEHELLFTEPIIVSVIASPPYYTGINEGGEGITEFGDISGSSSSTGTSHGFHAGLTFGAKYTAPFNLFEAQLKTSIEAAMDWGTVSTHEIKETWGYTTGVGEDKIVFTSLPFDVYYYEVLSSPDETEIGETVTINIPRKPGKYHQELQYFNEHTCGETIDSSILQHNLGEPFTYANMAERDQIRIDSGFRGLFSDSSLAVGASDSGSGFISIENLDGETDSYDFELSVTVEAELTNGLIIAGASAGYQYGYSYETTVTQGTWVKGQVPDIPTSDYPGREFKWGLMVYPEPLSTVVQKYSVVTYWVDEI